MKTQAWRREPASYPFSIEIAPRYADLDPWRHINNVAIASVHAEARMRWLMRALGDDAWRRQGPWLRAARLRTDFIGEGRYPAPIRAAVRCTAADEHGWELATALFQEGACIGVQHTRLGAWCDGLPVPLPGDVAAAVGSQVADDAADAGTASEPPPVPADFPLEVEVDGRYGDQDVDGAVAEVAVARFVEQARVIAMTGTLREARREMDAAGLGMLVAHTDVRFFTHRRPVPRWRVGVGIVRVGNTSLTVRTALWRDGACHALADSVLVVADRRAMRPAAVPAAVREHLMPYALGPAGLRAGVA